MASFEGCDCHVAVQPKPGSAGQPMAREWPSGHVVYCSTGHAAGTFTAPEAGHDAFPLAALVLVTATGPAPLTAQTLPFWSWVVAAHWRALLPRCPACPCMGELLIFVGSAPVTYVRIPREKCEPS
jgi:hypothetical protein